MFDKWKSKRSAKLAEEAEVAKITEATEDAARLIEEVPFGPLKEQAVKHYLEKVSYFGKRLVPPEIFVGDGDFLLVGEIVFHYLVELGGLKRSDRVLDVGAGQGRVAIPLTHYLSAGSYAGIEIVAAGVEWCQKHISKQYPKFRFQHADIFNKEYNPHGKTQAAEYRFPFADNTFDFVFLTSVFTHLLPQDMENYFSEISRVMKPEARCLITYFLLNQESLREMETPPTLFSFNHQMEGYRTIDPAVPEIAVAYDEDYVKGLYGQYGFDIVEPIHFGSWCGRPNPSWRERVKCPIVQDLIVAKKGERWKGK